METDMSSDNKSQQDTKLAMRVSGISIAVNIFLSVFKLAAGILAHSGAMISDAIHSASDVFSTIIVMIGINLAGRKSDREHPYGHERLECVAAILLAMMLGITGIGIGISGIEKITSGNIGALEVPGVLALTAAVVSIAVKEWMYWFTRAAAKKINSDALMADAWHHRSDALSSIGALVGIWGARSGYPVMDPAASVIICIFIVKAALDIFKDSMDKMVDKSCPEETVDEMKELILSQEGVEGLDMIRTRLFGAKVYVDVEILADGKKTLTEAHTVAEQVHHSIEDHFPDVKHCMVHVNPKKEPSQVPTG